VIAGNSRIARRCRGSIIAVGLIGTAQVTARYWVTTGEQIPKDEAVNLVSTLSWRGISRFPRASQ
jgi:hypothetical protein